jgi:hypothetical protein
LFWVFFKPPASRNTISSGGFLKEPPLQIIFILNFRVFQTTSYDKNTKIKVVDL